jgi:di/tripeptidase
LAGLEPACDNTPPTGRLAKLQAALELIEAEDAAAAEAAAHQVQAAAAAAEQGRHQLGRKPKDPRAALARAEIDYALALKRLEDLQAERERRAAAAARGEKTAGPRLRIDKAQAALEAAEARLAAARAAVEAAPATERRANVTDPDSRIMTTKDGWVQGYNAQAIVNPQQIVLAVEVSQDPADVQLFEPMNDKLTHTLTAVGITAPVELELADAGYCSEANLTCPGPDRLIALAKDHKQQRVLRERGYADGPAPPGLTATEEMEHLLRTPQGIAATNSAPS